VGVDDNGTTESSRSWKQRIGLIVGPLAGLIVLLATDLSPGHPEVTRTAAVALLMAIWWITEAIPIPATALLPVALFPLLGIMTGRAVAGTYFNHIIFLFIGGFIMALAMQRWNLHRRIALRIITLIGGSPRRIVLGFMVANAFLSMWISNTAATMMMVPIALAVIIKIRESDDSPAVAHFATGLLIGIAYAASIGGLATLIGTPPNLSFSRIFAIYFPNAPEVTFAQWFAFGLPLSVLMLFSAWGLIVLLFVRQRDTLKLNVELFRDEYRRLGRMSGEERTVLILFIVMALLWLFRRDISAGSLTIPGWSRVFPSPSFIDDGTVAIAVALLLFLIPARSQPGTRLMNWSTATKLHWGIVLLFGGGFALATGFKESGLSAWLAGQLTGLGGLPPVVLTGSVCTLLTFLTELTSNTATTEMVLPLLGSLAVAIHTHPLILMIPATLSASCAFMLPVATPPNAIVFGSGEVSMSDMIRAGIVLNLVGIVVITGMTFALGLTVFDIGLGQLPAWAIP